MTTYIRKKENLEGGSEHRNEASLEMSTKAL